MNKLKETYMLLLALVLMAACSNSEPDKQKEDVIGSGKGVIILCEGNYQAGNSTLSFYDPETKQVQNGVFQRVNAAKSRPIKTASRHRTIASAQAIFLIAVSRPLIIIPVQPEPWPLR